MATVSADELSDSPDALLDRVANGETLVVMRGNRAIAELRPPHPMPLSTDEVLARNDALLGLDRAKLPDGTNQLIEALDRHLASMSTEGDAELWSDEGLNQRQEWAEVRRLALAVLASLDIPYRDPTLAGVTYVQQ